MQRIILTVGLSVALSIGSFAQLQKSQIPTSKVPIPAHHHMPEYSFDIPVDSVQWTRQKSGLNVSFGSTDELYFRSEVPQLQQKTSHEQTAWRGERVNAQILVWSPDTLDQVRFKLSDLTNGKGQSLAKMNIQLNMIRYVLSNFPYGATAADCGAGPRDTAYLMPDRFESFDRFELPGRSVRPVWLQLDIPANTPAGEYNGTIEVLWENNKNPVKLNLKIKVQNQLLPKPADWKYRLDLWQNPWVVAWYYQLEPWSDAHKALLKKHLKMYADAGGKYITTYTVHSPWSDNSYMIEGTMVDWIKGKDGSWKFDYDIFDQYVQLAMEVGIDEAITIYTPVPWGHRFRYMDEATGEYVHEEWSPESVEFKKFWNIFLTDLKSHLEKKGWFKKTYLGINENPLNITIAAAKVIKDHSKDWRITYAGDWHAELTDILDDYSPILNKETSQEELQARKAKGFTTTFYNCCTPPKPNNFVFSPPVEGRFLGWYASAYGYDGFLRWAYDAWPEDPMRDARHTLWPAGDCFLVYPGGNTSIRFEKMREGIVDYEKIRIIRELAAKSTDKNVKSSLKEFDELMKSIVGTANYAKENYSLENINNVVTKGKQLLNQLSDQLGSRKEF